MPERQPARPAPPSAQPAPLFRESGASWYWVLFGPAAGAALGWIQSAGGYGVHPVMPVVLAGLVAGFLGIQVKAARVHTSVELTEQTLREGTETIRVSEIVLMHPVSPRGRSRSAKPPQWQSARTLGELSGVPRGRVGIGLKLTGGRTAQAWARNHRGLRAALASLVPHPDVVPPEPDDESPGPPW